MPYIGNIPADKFLTLAKQNFSTSATTSYTLDSAVSSTQDIALFINNVRQSPVDAYSVSGTALTLTSATAGTDEMYCVYLGKTVGTVSPSANSITNAMMTDDSVGLAELSATGTPSSSNFLRGDNSWATPTDNGKILQVVTGVSSAAATTTSNSFTQKATPTVSITPSSSSNKIYLSGHIYADPNTDYLMVTFGRVISGGATTTNISGETYGMGMMNVNRESSISFSYLDAPSTSSAISYYFYFKNDNGSTSVALGHNSVGASLTAMEVSA